MPENGFGCTPVLLPLCILPVGIPGLKRPVIKKLATPEIIGSCQVIIEPDNPVKHGGIGRLIKIFLVHKNKTEVGACKNLLLHRCHSEVSGQKIIGFAGGHIHKANAQVVANFTGQPGSG